MLNMLPHQYAYCLTEIRNYTEFEKYLWDLANSDIWRDPEDADLSENLLTERLGVLEKIWDACHLSVKDIGLIADGATGLARRFGVPRRTMEDWCAGKRKCPLYTRLMMQEVLKIYIPPLDAAGLVKKYFVECYYSVIDHEEPIYDQEPAGSHFRSDYFDSLDEVVKHADLVWAGMTNEERGQIEHYAVMLAAWDGTEYQPMGKPIRIYK